MKKISRRVLSFMLALVIALGGVNLSSLGSIKSHASELNLDLDKIFLGVSKDYTYGDFFIVIDKTNKDNKGDKRLSWGKNKYSQLGDGTTIDRYYFIF